MAKPRGKATIVGRSMPNMQTMKKLARQSSKYRTNLVADVESAYSHALGPMVLSAKKVGEADGPNTLATLEDKYYFGSAKMRQKELGSIELTSFNASTAENTGTFQKLAKKKQTVLAKYRINNNSQVHLSNSNTAKPRYSSVLIELNLIGNL